MIQANKKILVWEIGGVIFILFVGSTLHFAFELTDFWKPMALIAPVNESIWEHLKMVFWPGIIFFLVEYKFLKDCVSNYWTAKTLCLLLMPLVITLGWYSMVALTGKNKFALNIALFAVAIFLGQTVSHKILTDQSHAEAKIRYSIFIIVLLSLAFTSFTYYPPKIFLFEHMDLLNTGQYGILDSYQDLQVFRK